MTTPERPHVSAQRAQESIVVRRAGPMDRPRIEAFCRGRGYRGFLSPEAAVVIAERGVAVLGLGRVQPDDGVLVLRGMGVDSGFRRRGIGTRLLELLLSDRTFRRRFESAEDAQFLGRRSGVGFASSDLLFPVFGELDVASRHDAGAIDAAIVDATRVARRQGRTRSCGES